MQEVRFKFFTAEAGGYFAKPVSRGQLFEAIKESGYLSSRTPR